MTPRTTTRGTSYATRAEHSRLTGMFRNRAHVVVAACALAVACRANPKVATPPSRSALASGATASVLSEVPGDGLARTTRAPHTLEVVRLDDSLDPFPVGVEKTLPRGVRIEGDRGGKGRYARVAVARAETEAEVRKRLAAWLGDFALPHHARFGLLAEVTEGIVTGFASVVLVGDSAVHAEDVVATTLDSAPPSSTPNDDVEVMATLSPPAMAKLEAATRDWVGRRLAIIVDGEIQNAPIVKAALRGAGLGIPSRLGNAAERRARAARLAAELKP